MERLLSADNPGLIAAYEEQVRGLHARKVALQEKLAKPGQPVVSFDKTYRTALTFVANPRKLWDFGNLATRRLVPKLLFGGRVPYKRNLGYRTGGIAHPFRALRLIQNGQYDMVPQEGIEPPTHALRSAWALSKALAYCLQSIEPSRSRATKSLISLALPRGVEPLFSD